MKVAIIPARGGSKRIPRKNIKLFCGQPMLAYPIQTALKSGCFDRIIVSTDDDEIAEIARQYGAEVPATRPAELADDHTGTSAVVRYELSQLLQQGAKISYCCCIYATTPLLSAVMLQQAWQQLSREPALNYVFSAARFSFPIQRALLQTASGVRPFDSSSIGKRSQDLAPTFHDAGQFYWGRTAAWLDNKAIFADHSKMLILPDHLVQDIDTSEDWHRAELLFQLLQQEPPR
ncbi:pseudaminic acid cytidylyltransferase [Arsukibacterium indicum]|uniref:Pseudaminic acid cytidylyltransferase n=1 Tax=Arsukibacterium indicum TaxID=2848612 RepID=A0ABS6MGC1_9GAMM|nr:pseudaminic acid cytidylyltransferase [Arsukibacterium indicum]MBV2127865.1 pseudaminic acid cytidylyltransferase [Arsukibacterium indicum]